MLLFEGGVAETTLKGPDNPILKQEVRALREKRKGGGLTDEEKSRLEEEAKTKAEAAARKEAEAKQEKPPEPTKVTPDRGPTEAAV